jgi:hypothetical protein
MSYSHNLFVQDPFNIIVPSTPRSMKFSSSKVFRLTLCMHFYIVLCVLCYMSFTFHPPWFDYPNNICWRIQIMKLLIIEFHAHTEHKWNHVLMFRFVNGRKVKVLNLIVVDIPWIETALNFFFREWPISCYKLQFCILQTNSFRLFSISSTLGCINRRSEHASGTG